MNYTSKRSILGGIAALAVMTMASTAMATLVLYEEFDHPDGSLVGNTPNVGGVWATHSGTAGQMQVASGQAVVNHSLTEDANSAFTSGAMGPGDKLYAAFDLTVPAQAANPGTVYFAHFKDAGNFFGSRVFITAPLVSGNGYRLGISGNATLAAGETWASDLAFDTTYRIVTSYDYDTADAQMWIDPSSEASTSVVSTESAFLDAMQAYAFRESSANSRQLIDCLQVATSFAEAAVCIPEPATVTMLLLGVLGLVGLRRRVR